MAITTSRDTHVPHGGPAGATRYYVVWILLLVGTVLTFLTSRIHLPSPWHLLLAMAIATGKSALVVLFFMHLWDHPGANRVVFGTSLVFVALLIGLVLLDNATRFVLTNPGHRGTLQMEPPGPDILTPRGWPEPSRRLDMPEAGEPGHSAPAPSGEGRQ